MSHRSNKQARRGEEKEMKTKTDPYRTIHRNGMNEEGKILYLSLSRTLARKIFKKNCTRNTKTYTDTHRHTVSI